MIEVSFTLTDGRGRAYQIFDTEEDALSFYNAIINSENFADVVITGLKEKGGDI